MYAKAASLLLLFGLSLNWSMCSKPSGGGEASKDPEDNVADVNLAGVDTSTLTPREKREWSGYVSELLAPCSNTPVSIAQCVQEKRACNKCLPAAKLILRGVRDGFAKEQIENAYHNRFDADHIKNVPIDDSPTRGSTAAPVVIVEFADFTCPHCQALAPSLDKFLDEHKDTVLFAYKFFPLNGPGHERSEPAARAAWAAKLQGKFWEMHHKLFTNPEHMEQGDLEQYARDIGLDVAKFRADMQSQATTDKIAADKKLGESLNVMGTPTLFIDGREYDKSQGLEDWVDLELQLKGEMPAPGKPAPGKPAASASASAAPAASASSAPKPKKK